MKMIDVLNIMAEGKIENDTKLIASTDLVDYEYRYSTGYHTFFDKYSNRIEGGFFLDKDFLNLEVELIPPKPKKYYLRLNKDNDFSYVNWDKRSSYEFATSCDYFGYKTKFTQKEIDDNEFLKFVEKYGIKEEAKDDED